MPNLDLVENLRMAGEKKKPLLDEVEKISEMANFVYVRQKGPYGNGTPLLNVQHIVGDEPFIYTWSDDFIVAEPSRFKQLISTYEKYGGSVLGSIKATKDEDYDRYGFTGGEMLEDGVMRVKEVIEKPGKENSPSDLANVSGFLFTPDIFSYLKKAQENLKEGQEFYYNDALKLMLNDGKPVFAKEIKDGKYYDTGNKLEYLKTVVEFALKHPDLSVKFREYLASLKI
jgi:UTP--glucose-1-phosphate uridylyltransferase